MTADVSIVIPTRDRGHVLGECIDSLIAQGSDARLEIIVVEDGTTSDTREQVEARIEPGRARGVDVRYLTQSQGGPNPGRNAGVEASTGDLVGFVDDDVDVPGGWLQAMLDGARRHPEAAGFGGPIRLRIEGKAPRTCSNESIATELDLGPSEVESHRLWTANLIVRREALDAVGPFEPSIPVGAGDEEQWLLRLHRSGRRLVYLPDAWLWHRRTDRDLVFTRMLKGKYRRGYNQPPFFRWAGFPLSRSKDLRLAFAWVGHAVRRRCAGGLLEAAQCLGRFRGIAHNDAVVPPQPEISWSPRA